MSRADEPRLLAARSELGYVRDQRRALRGEPEAVDRQAQARFSLAARREQERRRREEWSRTHSTISHALQTFRARCPDRRVLDATRAVERAAERVDRLL